VRRLLQILATPHGLFAVLFLVAAGLYFLFTPSASEITIRVPTDNPDTLAAQTLEEIRLVVVDTFGVARRYVVDLEVSPDLGERIEQILTKLRSDMLAGNGWPKELSVPNVYLQDIDEQLVAIMDFRLVNHVSLDVNKEINLYQAISETVLSNGVNRILVLKDGRPAETFLGHLAVPNKP